MDSRVAIVLAAAVLLLCFAIEAKVPVVVIGSTTFTLSVEVQKCMDIVLPGGGDTPKPGGDIKRCLRRLRDTTRAPNETYFADLGTEVLIAEEGSSALLRCEIINLGGKDVFWKRGGKILSSMGSLYVADRRFKMESFNSTFNIRIEPVRKSDAGRYKCQVLATRGNAEACERIVEVEVPSLPSIISMGPTSAPYFDPSDPDRRYFNLTSDVTLYCNATGSPEPTVSWERVQLGPDPIGGSSPVWGDTVFLKNITERDAGVYNCTASNGVGQVERLMELVVQYKPVARSPVPSIRAGRGQYVTLVCEVSAVPRAEIVWRRGQTTLLTAGQGTVRKGKQSTRYIIVSVDPDEDYGSYTCAAANMMGSSEVTIEVHGRPLSPTVTSAPLSSRRHAYSLTWKPGTSSDGRRSQKIPVSTYIIAFRGWWIEIGALQRVVYSHERPLREVVPARDGRQSYSYVIRDLRPNTTYDLTIYGQNQYGNGDTTAFTFYTAIENAPSTPRFVTTTDGKATIVQKVNPEARQSGSGSGVASGGQMSALSSVAILTLNLITVKLCR